MERGVPRGGSTIAVCLAEDGTLQRPLGHEARLVTGLELVGQGLLAQAGQLRLREVGAQRHVGEEAEPGLETCHRNTQSNRRGVPRRGGRDLGAQEIDLVRQSEGALPRRPLVEHGRRHGRDTVATGRVGDGPLAHHQDDLGHRHLTVRDEMNGKAVREGQALRTGQHQRAHGPRPRRP